MTRPVSILRQISQVRSWRKARWLSRESVGFVPTMGALHEGHFSLISQSLKENDRTIVSIFVNPAQFGPTEDLDAYPRTLESDLESLSRRYIDTPVEVFVPKTSEMYPSGIDLHVSKQRGAFVTVLGCSEQLEGASRPQFFRGVATVVTKLLNLIAPSSVYFGQKDAQQCVVIRNLVKDLMIDTKVRVVPTRREDNGLAMSSRNAYLSDSVKQKSSVIYRALQEGERFYRQQSKENVTAKDVLNCIRNVIEPSGFHIEYLSINHPETLDELEYIDQGVGALVSTAVRVPNKSGDGETRLIDNIIIK